MSLLGVDIGTTGVKAVAFGDSGNLLATAYQEYPVRFPAAGFAELDSEAVIDAACSVIAQAAEEVRTYDPVVAVGIASHGEAFTPVAADGRFLRNALAFSDTRAESLVKPWSEDFGTERLYRITGHPPYTMYSLFKLLWVKEHEREVWDSAWKVFFFADLLAYVLTGEAMTDYSLAARSMLFDVKDKVWSSEILDQLGLAPERLPQAAPAGETVGTVKSSLQGRLGLGRDVAVVVAGHDQPVGALGCGAAVPGMASYAIGTAECICPVLQRLILGPELMKSNLASYPHALPDAYTTVAFSLTCGNVLKWLRDNLATEETEEARRRGESSYDHIVAAASTEPAQLILIPHFGPTGTPHFDAQSAGVLLGLTFSTERSEIFRAFLEGITYDMKWNLSILADAGFELTELRVIGGGARSDTWMQIKADILGVPLTTMQVVEATCMGAAMLAGHGVRVLDVREASLEWAKPAGVFLPRSSRCRLYDDRFAIYREAYNSLALARRMLHSLKHEEG